jgi:hypothetical protein
MASATLTLKGILQNAKGSPESSKVVLNDPLQPEQDRYVYPSDDPRHVAALAFSAAAQTVEMFQEVFGDFKWSFKWDKLAVNSNAGKDFNAFYAKRQGSVNFFSEEDPIFGRLVSSGASNEIVAHEVGHALLDAVRPEYLNAWRADVGAFHESFADMMALHMSLLDERVIRRVVVQTGGDLSKPNIVAHLAEELGQGINNKKGSNQTGGNYLRNANNNFTWADPKTLPEKGGPDELGWGKHSFSRLWTGAHYDVLEGMVSAKMQAGMAADEALRQANRELFRMLAQLLPDSPRGDFTYQDMAIAFIRSHKKHGGEQAQLLETVFRARKILPEDLDPALLEPDNTANLLPDDEVRTFQIKLGPKCGAYAGARVEVPVSAERALFKNDIASETEAEISRLIEAGQIRYTSPWEKLEFPRDYFDSEGRAYTGIVRWVDGQMHIERSGVVN